MERLRYYLREGLKNVWVNRMMTIASVSVLAICLLLLGSSLLISVYVKGLMSQIEDTNQIMIYLKDSVDQTGIDAMSDTLKAMSNVENVTFVSKQEALESQKKELGDKGTLLQGYESDNFYPNAFRVQVRKMSGYNATVSAINRLDGVENIKSNSAIARKLNNISRVIGIVGLWLFVLMAVVSLFLISNTIKVAVYVRRREINIMKFVGATDTFIRWPFVIEGAVMGLISGIVAIVAQWYVYRQLIYHLFTVLNVRTVLVPAHLTLMGVCFVISGVLVGVLGSAISMRRYLQV